MKIRKEIEKVYKKSTSHICHFLTLEARKTVPKPKMRREGVHNHVNYGKRCTQLRNVCFNFTFQFVVLYMKEDSFSIK